MAFLGLHRGAHVAGSQADARARPAGRRHACTIIVVSVALTGVLALLIHPFEPDKECCDHLAYRSMSYNLFTVTRPDLNVPPPGNAAFNDPAVADFELKYHLNHLPPYVYRIVTPLLARLIASVSTIDVAYYLITLLALAGAAVFTGLSILEVTQAVVPAIAGVVVFLVNPYSTGFNLRDFMLTDPMAFLLAALAVWALVRRNRGLFFVACLVGVLNKESMVPMLVAYPLSELWLERRIREGTMGAAVCIAIGWYLFRIAMPEAVAGYSVIREFRPGLHHVHQTVTAGIVTFGVLAPAAIRRSWRSKLVYALMPFSVGAVLAAWFVGDVGRAMIQALPVVCLALFSRWPPSRLEQVLALLVVPFAGLSMLLSANGMPGWLEVPQLNWYRGIALLSVIAAAAELSLWRLHRSVPTLMRDERMSQAISVVSLERAKK